MSKCSVDVPVSRVGDYPYASGGEPRGAGGGLPFGARTAARRAARIRARIQRERFLPAGGGGSPGVDATGADAAAADSAPRAVPALRRSRNHEPCRIGRNVRAMYRAGDLLKEVLARAGFVVKFQQHVIEQQDRTPASTRCGTAFSAPTWPAGRACATSIAGARLVRQVQERLIRPADGVYGQKKEGADFAYDNTWSYSAIRDPGGDRRCAVSGAAGRLSAHHTGPRKCCRERSNG